MDYESDEFVVVDTEDDTELGLFTLEDIELSQDTMICIQVCWLENQWDHKMTMGICQFGQGLILKIALCG